MKVTKVKALERIANKIRIDIVEEVNQAKSGHLGGSLSCTDILTVLYFNEMNISPDKPKDLLRDRFVLSKGHASTALYATLAERGYFPKEDLLKFRKFESYLQGHPDMNKVPGVDITTGSLGQGLSIANGMAIASKMNKAGYRVYCLIGDGELQEGQIWEAMMTSSKYKLDNLCVIIDCNKLQLTGETEKVKELNYESIEDRFNSFGFNTITIDGNNIDSVMSAFSVAERTKGLPTAIIARTVKGKGVSFMENKVEWHGKAMNDEEYKKAIEELKTKERSLEDE
ncbi:MAG: transketolase [Clostridia bacterium]|nr:transketolase [Clostridia bacterium]